jgi:hypothetical protein
MPFCQENDLKNAWQVVCLYISLKQIAGFFVNQL